MIKLSRRIELDKITARAKFSDVTSESFPDSDSWKVTLTRTDSEGRRHHLSTQFFTGYGLRERMPDGPSAEDVLESMLLDASGYENAQGFADWCSEYGYDSDSRKAEAVYRATGKQTEKLRKFLGDAYKAYVWETDHD
jgi:hypothetical protein